MRKLTDKQIAEIERLFSDYKNNQQLTTKLIAEKMNLSTSTIEKQFARHFGEDYRALTNAKKIKMNEKQIRSMFEEYKLPGMNVTLLAKKYGITAGTVIRYFSDIFGEEYTRMSPMKITGRGKRRLTDSEIEEIFKEYKNNPRISQEDLARKYSVNVRTIWRQLKLRFGDDFRKLSIKKCGWQRKLTDEEIKSIFLEYKNGTPSLELSKKYSISREGLISRLERVIGDEFKEVAATRRLEDIGRKKQKVSNEGIRRLFEIYKNSNMSVDELANSAGLAESSLISRFKRLFGSDYKNIAFGRRDERRITKEGCKKAFERYKETDVSITELSDELEMRVSSLASRFRKLFGVEYLEVAQRKMDLVEVNRKGKIAEGIAVEYLKLDGKDVKDVRRSCILKGSMKRPDFLFDDTFVEVKSGYITLNGFGKLKGYKKIINDYMGKEILGENKIILAHGVIISMSGFSKDVRIEAVKDNIELVGPEELRKKFKENDKNETLKLLDGFRTK